MSQVGASTHKVLDLCGLRCPHLLIKVIAAVRDLEPDEMLQVRATDLNAPSSIGAWSRQSGNELVDMYQEGNYFVFLLQRNPQNDSRHKVKRVSLSNKEEDKKLTATS